MKIIISNKCREHMEAHRKDFLIYWEDLISEYQKEGKFDNITKPFEIITIKVHHVIGYCNLVETYEKDEIVYAKRVNREIYTRFVKNVVPEPTNSAVFILKKNANKSGEYYLISMFPGYQNHKEPEDINIGSKEELINSLEFWKNHALVYDESTIDVNSIKNYCPYKNLYIAVV
jgi:hypothetical protein